MPTSPLGSSASPRSGSADGPRKYGGHVRRAACSPPRRGRAPGRRECTGRTPGQATRFEIGRRRRMKSVKSNGLAGLLLMAVVGWGSLAGTAEAPTIFWASDPVRPGETVVVQGGNFGDHTVVETAPGRCPIQGCEGKSPAVKDWVKVEPLQKSACSLKFIVPAQWKMGTFSAGSLLTG